MVQSFLFLMASLLVASSAAVAGEAPATRAQIEAAAEKCGLPKDSLVFGEDRDGAFADFADQPAPEPKREGVLCLLQWAMEHRGRVTVFLEPNRRPIAYGPSSSIERIKEGARGCGLRTYTDPTDDKSAVLNIRRGAPAEAVQCLQDWIEARRGDLRLRDLAELD